MIVWPHVDLVDITKERHLMSGKIPIYKRVEFASDDLADAASGALMNFVTSSQETIARMAGTDRVVMWHENMDVRNRVLLLSPSAHRILSGLLVLPDATDLPVGSLPPGRQLMLGDARFETFD